MGGPDTGLALGRCPLKGFLILAAPAPTAVCGERSHSAAGGKESPSCRRALAQPVPRPAEPACLPLPRTAFSHTQQFPD